MHPLMEFSVVVGEYSLALMECIFDGPTPLRERYVVVGVGVVDAVLRLSWERTDGVVP